MALTLGFKTHILYTSTLPVRGNRIISMPVIIIKDFVDSIYLIYCRLYDKLLHIIFCNIFLFTVRRPRSLKTKRPLHRQKGIAVFCHKIIKCGKLFH